MPKEVFSKKAMSASSDRSSIVDVYENYLGTDVRNLSESLFEALSPPQATELIAQLDRFLEAAAQEEYVEDAVTLDGFASPTIIPFDRSEPRTTRRAKQIALSHTEVIIPLQEVSLDYSELGRNHLASFGIWTKNNAQLLRAHVFSPVRAPSPLDIFDVDGITELGDWLVANITAVGHEVDLGLLIPGWREKKSEELIRTLNPIVYSTMQDAIAGGVFNTSLSFTQETAGRFYQFCAQTLGRESTGTGGLFSHTALLQELELPAIEDLPDEDFVGIRRDAEGFHEFRSVLGRALRETSQDVEGGMELNTSFQTHLGEVRWRAALLARETQSKTLAKFFRSSAQGITIGSFVSTAAAAAATMAQHASVDMGSLTARFGTSAALGTLFALLLYKRPTSERRLLRFYDVLLNVS